MLDRAMAKYAASPNIYYILLRMRCVCMRFLLIFLKVLSGLEVSSYLKVSTKEVSSYFKSVCERVAYLLLRGGEGIWPT